MASKTPFDMTELMKLFDPEKIARMFDPKQMTAALDPSKFKGFDLTSTMEANKRNFDAMVAANTAAASAYKSFYEKQMSIYKDVMSGAAAQAEALKSGSPADLEKQRADIYATAVTKSLELMTDFAAATKTANENAYSVIEKRMGEVIKELKSSKS